MSCWNVLGLSPDADTRTIKRQYAALLKNTRPDEDPQGFQRLREAYEAALDWSQRACEEDDQDVTLEPAPVAAHAETLQAQYQRALAAGAGLGFEIGLLQHFVAADEIAVDDWQWAFDTFNWLSAWQRLELPEPLVDALEAKCKTTLLQPLRQALEDQDDTAFIGAYAARTHQPWLDKSPHAEWFNLWLAKLLLESRYWSPAVFDAVCAGQAWHGGTDHNCPPDDWPQLLRRQQAPAFLARQRALAAEPPNTPQQRAARLLLAPMSLGQRRAFAQRLNAEDWAACQRLSADIYADHLDVSESMPGRTPYFWQGWEGAIDTWPLVIATVLACLVGGLVQAEALAGVVTKTLGTASLWALAFVVGGGLAWQVWRPLAHQYRVLDERLSARLPRWLSPTRLPLLPLRDLVPGALMMAALGYQFGPAASATLVLVLAVIGLFKRLTLKTYNARGPYNPQWTSGAIALCITAFVVVYTGLKMLDNQQLVTRNQGLQQWTERLCSRLPAEAPGCMAPATDAQWYGQEARQ